MHGGFRHLAAGCQQIETVHRTLDVVLHHVDPAGDQGLGIGVALVVQHVEFRRLDVGRRKAGQFAMNGRGVTRHAGGQRILEIDIP